MGGFAQRPSDSPCFTNSTGAIFNSCPTTRQYCFALSNDGAGWVGVQVNGTGSAATDVMCAAQAIAADGSPDTPTGFVSLPGPGTSTIYLPGIYAGGWGASFACCNIAPGARINTVTW